MLTDLQSAKDWLNLSSEIDDDLLTSLIGQVSSMIVAYLSRPYIFKRQYTDSFQGSCMSSRMLRNYPVIDVSSVSCGYLPVPASDGNSPGFWLEPDEGVPPGRLQLVQLSEYRFERGLCSITYDAGNFVLAELQTADTMINVNAPWGAWAIDAGVTYATGAALVLVAGAPQKGQYALAKQRGQYVFAAADNGAGVLISYSYVPAAIEQACIEIVGERYRYRSRIGKSTESFQGNTTAGYKLTDMPDYIRTSLEPYRRRVPL